MSLEDRLEEQRRRAYESRDDEGRRVRAQAIAGVAVSGLIESALGVGDKIPPVVLPDAAGTVVDVAELLREGPAVLSFYRGGWCPYCNLELRALQNHLAEFKELGAHLVAISPERPDNSLSTVEKNALTFPVLSDASNTVSRAFGLVHRIDPEVVGYQRENGVDVAAVNGEAEAEVPVPATYIVDRRGFIRYAVVDADYTHRAEPALVVSELARIVAEEQHAD